MAAPLIYGGAFDSAPESPMGLNSKTKTGTKTRFLLGMWRELSSGVLLGGLGGLVASDAAVSKWPWPHRGDVRAVVEVPGESALQTDS